MAPTIEPEVAARAWRVTKRQHGVIARVQLLDFGISPDAIRHRIDKGRLHRVAWGVYAVGRPTLTQHGRWMAAVLCCGAGAVLSHHSAAALWRIPVPATSAIHVSVPGALRRRPGLVVHKRKVLKVGTTTTHLNIPVTTPARTLIDMATSLDPNGMERAIDEADSLDLVTPDQLRRELNETRQPGVRRLRRILDRRTFVLTDSRLERLFLPLARAAGLSKPQTRCYVNGFKVDFYWPELGLVVETDSLRYHRTPAEQARDRLRDQAHIAAGLTPIRFSHGQVAFEPSHVLDTLHRVAQRVAHT